MVLKFRRALTHSIINSKLKIQKFLKTGVDRLWMTFLWFVFYLEIEIFLLSLLFSTFGFLSFNNLPATTSSNLRDQFRIFGATHRKKRRIISISIWNFHHFLNTALTTAQNFKKKKLKQNSLGSLNNSYLTSE